MGPQNWTLDPTPKTPLDPPPRNSLCTVFCWENQHLHKEFGRLNPLLDPPARVPPKFFMQIFFGCFFPFVTSKKFMWIDVLWACLRVAMWITHVGGKFRHGLLEKSLPQSGQHRVQIRSGLAAQCEIPPHIAQYLFEIVSQRGVSHPFALFS